MLGMEEISLYVSNPSGWITTPGAAFEVIGVDFARPMKFRKSSKEGKSYLVIFACSLSRTVHLELLRNLETSTFIVP
jgi:hypothetical protein